MPDSSVFKAPRHLSNEDIHILLEIVNVASEESDVDVHLAAAVRRAYETVCDRHGISRKRDPNIIRFTWELQRKPADQSLRTWFTELLRERDIFIESVSGSDDEEVASEHGTPEKNAQPSRRESLDSFDSRVEARDEPESRRPESRTSYTQYDENTNPLPPGSQWPQSRGVKGRPFNLSMIANPSPVQRRDLYRDPEPDGLLGHEPDLRPPPFHNNDDWHPAEFRYLKSARHHVPPLPEHVLNNHAEEVVPIEESEFHIKELEQIAVAYNEKRLEKLLSRYFQGSQRFAGQLHYCALVFEKDILAHKALKRVRNAGSQALQRRHQEMEQMAVQRRDMSLIYKAFTHWFQCWKDETEKTLRAKQHLIALRYFNAWREYTITNETKIRHHVLQTYLGRWRNSLAKFSSKAEWAFDQSNSTLLCQTFVDWKWTYRERWAEQGWHYRAKRKTLAALVGKFQTTRDKESFVVKSGCRRALQLWQNRKEDVDKLSMRAIEHSSCHALKDSFGSWRIQHRFAPLERGISDKFDERILRSTFSTWIFASRLYKAGKDACRHRILRTFWDTWDERRRCQIVAQQINERVVIDCLHKWVLAERRSLFERVRTWRLASPAKLLEHHSHLAQDLTNAWDAFRASQRERQQRVVLRLWLNKTQTYQRHEVIAVARDTRQTTNFAFEMFQLQHNDIQMLEKQYLPLFTLFYKGKQTLSTLNEAAKQSRMKKRHEAYVLARRRHKQNLCKKLLTKWREDTRKAQGLKDMATERYEGKLMILGTDLFDHWKQHSAALKLRWLQASIDRDTSNLVQHFTIWAGRHEVAQDNAEKALEYDREHSRRAAYRCLRVLHFRIRFIQERQMGSHQTELRQWSQRDLARNLLRLWLERTLRQRGVPETDMPPTAKTRRFKSVLRNMPSQAVQDDPEPTEQQSVLERATAAAPSPSTPSRRFGRGIRTPAANSNMASLRQAQPAQMVVPSETPAAPVPSLTVPATDSRVRPNRAFGRSIGVRRTLFAPPPPIPERSSFP